MMKSKCHIRVGKKQVSVVITFLLLFFISQAGATTVTCTSNDAIQIDVVSSAGSGTITVNPSAFGLNWDNVFENPGTAYTWRSPDSQTWDIYDGGTKLATVDQLSLTVQGDPTMDFGFAVKSYYDAAFLISSPLLTFGEITNPSEARAYSDVSTVMPTKLIGNFPDGKVYRAAYNITESFADLVQGPIQFPPTGTGGPILDSITGGVTSMQGLYSFSLSEGIGGIRSANAVSEFSITPEPATLALLALGSLVIRRRKA